MGQNSKASKKKYLKKKRFLKRVEKRRRAQDIAPNTVGDVQMSLSADEETDLAPTVNQIDFASCDAVQVFDSDSSFDNPFSPKIRDIPEVDHWIHDASSVDNPCSHKIRDIPEVDHYLLPAMDKPGIRMDAKILLDPLFNSMYQRQALVRRLEQLGSEPLGKRTSHS